MSKRQKLAVDLPVDSQDRTESEMKSAPGDDPAARDVEPMLEHMSLEALLYHLFFGEGQG